MEGINICPECDDSLGAALTNSTELSFKKGKIENHYPIEIEDKVFPDAETACLMFRTGNIRTDVELMAEIIAIKLKQYPELFEAIKANGGAEWLQECSHIVGVKGSRWEGRGLDSNFILALTMAYVHCEETSLA